MKLHVGESQRAKEMDAPAEGLATGREARQGVGQRTSPRLPKRLIKKDRPYLPKRHRRGIKLDTVKASDLRIYDLRFFCDDCSHYDSSGGKCTMGYRAQHTRAEQMALFELSGKMAFCRMIEID